MRHHRLPEPPAVQNQVYAIVRKFKAFISSKKSPKSSQQKLYENTSQTGTQFYVECRKSHEFLENTLPASQLSNSEKNLLASQSQLETQQQPPSASASLLRPKEKNGKSLRSRLRKSLVGGAFDTKHLATLAATRSTFYVEDPPEQLPKPELEQEGELDSGFSDKGPVGPEPSAVIPSAESQKFSTVARKAKKEAKLMRRRATIGVRPHEPPPPPPPPLHLTKSQVVANSMSLTTPTSWYAECGVFKQSTGAQTPSMNADGELTTPTANGGGSSWYAESGLYQTSGNSEASSSGSSGVSTGNEAGLGDELQPHSFFSNEPLYQVYSAAKQEVSQGNHPLKCLLMPFSHLAIHHTRSGATG